MVCTPLPALSLMVTVPLRVPVAVGVKVTVSEQLAPAAKVPLVLPAAMQVLLCAKSVTVLAMPEIFKVALPLLLSVTLCDTLVVPTAWEAKFRLAGERLATGPIPVPVTRIICGLPPPLSFTFSVELTVPAFIGANPMLMVQLAPAVTVPDLLPDGIQIVV